jgi:hypothetical protein
MAILNRVVTVLVLLALIPIITIGLIAPREAIELLTDLLDKIYEGLDPSPSALQMLIRVGLALLIDAALVFLIYLQVRRPAETGVRIQQVKGGEAQIAVDSVVDRLTHQLDRLPGVLDVEPTVVPRRRGVEVALDVDMSAEGTISANIEEISAVTRRVIEEDMGLKLKGKPKVNLRTVAYREPVRSAELPVPSVAQKTDEIEEEAATPNGDEEPALTDETTVGDKDEPGSVSSPD